MDTPVVIQIVESSLNNNKNDEGDSTFRKGYLEDMTIKEEVKSEDEQSGEGAVKEEKSAGNAGHVSLFEGDPPELKIFLKKEETMNKSLEMVNFPVAKESQDEEDPLYIIKKEKTEVLGDFEFQSVGESTSTGIVNCKVEDNGSDDSFHEEEMNFPIVTDDSALEEDPLELKLNVHENIFKHHIKKKIKKLKNEPGSHIESLDGLKYKCSSCLKTFYVISDLNSHLQENNGESQFACNHCGKSFPNICGLKYHLRICAGEKPFRCTLCRKSYSVVSSLKNHLKLHYGKKLLTCEHCQKSFYQPSHLKIHLRKHTGEKPFTCQLCQKSFSTHSILKNHLKLHST